MDGRHVYQSCFGSHQFSNFLINHMRNRFYEFFFCCWKFGMQSLVEMGGLIHIKQKGGLLFSSLQYRYIVVHEYPAPHNIMWIELCTYASPKQNKMSETRTKKGLSTVEITISFPPCIRSFLSDILFCLGNTCTLNYKIHEVIIVLILFEFRKINNEIAHDLFWWRNF